MHNKALWNNEMDLCIGMITELDLDEFISQAKKSHLWLTGEAMPSKIEVHPVHEHDIWKLEVLI
jgi:hypothetical protein